MKVIVSLYYSGNYQPISSGIKKYQEESLERNGNCKENEQLKKITSEIEVFTSQV